MEHGPTRLLIDAGLSAKEIVERLALIHVDASSLDGIFISHEHQDHIAGADVLSRKFKIPIFISPHALQHSSVSLQEATHYPIAADVPVQLGFVTVTPFSVPHDSIDPLAFSLRAGAARACVVSDIGFLPESVKERMRGADILVIESNHDLEMLRTGPYPWHLKQRVMSNYGHLSNEAIGYFFSEYFDGTDRKIMLIHLSKQNNHPQLAYVSASRGLERGCKNFSLHLSLQDEVSDVVEV